MSDYEIDELKKLKPEIAEEFLDEHYAHVYGKFHKQNDTVFSMDKGWDVTKFLLKKVDFSTNKILRKLDEKYIKSADVKEIANVLTQISIEKIMDECDQN